MGEKKTDKIKKITEKIKLKKNGLNWLEYLKTFLVRFGFNFVMLKPIKLQPNQTGLV